LAIWFATFEPMAARGCEKADRLGSPPIPSAFVVDRTMPGW
jgi:hypothetical protein